MSAELTGVATRVYSCPFDGCVESFTCHPEQFDTQLQKHLDVAHHGFTTADLQAQIRHALRPAK